MMRLGHVLLRQFYARNAFGIQTSIFLHSDKVRSGSAALGAALGAAGLFIWMPSSALLESHTDESGPCSEQSKYFPDIFSRKGINSGQQEPYVAYNREGQTVPLGEIVQRMEAADVVLLGETHDDSIAHQLQLQLLLGALKQTRQTGRQLALSLEMFERDVQGVMDEYLAGSITERDLRQDARPWPNYDTDYRPMVEVAKNEGLPVICANAPRRYVSLAGRSGREALEQLPQEARQWLAPLPYRQPSQAYIHKTNWTMQQAKEELDAASKQSEELSSEASSAGGIASIAQQCPALQESTSAADIAAQNGLAASSAEQRSAWRGSPASLKAEQNSSAPLTALQGSYAGRELPLLRQEDTGPSHEEAPSADNRPSAVQQSDSKAECGGAVQKEVAAGAVQEQDVGAASESGKGEGCPYIGFTMSSNFLDAQCLWDATMAYSIAEGLGRDKASQQAALLQSADTDASASSTRGSTGMQSTVLEAKRDNEQRLQAVPGEGAALAARLSPLVLHVCGKFHSEGWMGIYEHIHAYHAANRRQQGCTSKQLNVVIVTFLPSSRDLALTSEEFRQEQLAAYGDYVILTDYNRPRSFEIGHPV